MFPGRAGDFEDFPENTEGALCQIGEPSSLRGAENTVGRPTVFISIIPTCVRNLQASATPEDDCNPAQKKCAVFFLEGQSASIAHGN